MTDTAQPAGDPELPYAGTSGWSGSATSRERAERDDQDGTTSARQTATHTELRVAREYGITWKELGRILGWHHGQASGVLSVLHKTGRIARLTERRDRCAVYVLPEYVNDRETAPHGRKQRLTDRERHVATVVQGRADLLGQVTMLNQDVQTLLDALARLSGETFR